MPVVGEVLPLVDEEGLIGSRARLAGSTGIQQQPRSLLPVLVPRRPTLGRCRHGDLRVAELASTPGVKREHLKPVMGPDRPGEVIGQDAMRGGEPERGAPADDYAGGAAAAGTTVPAGILPGSRATKSVVKAEITAITASRVVKPAALTVGPSR